MTVQNTNAENGVTKGAENSLTGIVYSMNTNGTNAIIDNQANNADNQGAGENHTEPAGIENPEDTGGMAEIIEAQGRQIERLIEANSNLMQQIGVMLRSGAAITDTQPQAQPPADPTKADDYVSLADLGKEVGKHVRKD